MHKRIALSLSLLTVSILACEPVIAIGWPEILIISGLVAFLLGPPLYKLYRRWEKFKTDLKQKDRRQ
jgi:hypothetical protein